MCASFMKRVVPFVVALKIGVLLVMLAGVFDSPWRRARGSVSQMPAQSRTWLIIRNVPALTYTEQEARLKGATDTLRLRALLDANGTVSEVELLSEATAEFADDAVRAAQRIRFRPATEDGRPIPLWVTVDYSCSGYYFAHRYTFGCTAGIAEVEHDWRVIHE